MILIMKDIHLKSLFEEYFQHYGILAVGSMYFRPYNAAEDEIISNYSKYDWHQIFANMTETELRDICTCANVVVLLWCDRATNTPHGMLYLEENFQKREKVFFHGGTWNHEAKFFKEIFRSIIAIFDFLLKTRPHFVQLVESLIAGHINSKRVCALMKLSEINLQSIRS